MGIARPAAGVLFALAACAGAPPPSTVANVVEVAPPVDPPAGAPPVCPEGSHLVGDICVADGRPIPKWEPHGIGDPCGSWGRPELGLQNCDPANEGDPDMDHERGAIVRALADAKIDLATCKSPKGPRGRGNVEVTFAANGKATAARVVGAPYVGTATGACVAARFRSIAAPPFTRKTSITVVTPFTID